jgi:hypothetical protein
MGVFQISSGARSPRDWTVVAGALAVTPAAIGAVYGFSAFFPAGALHGMPWGFLAHFLERYDRCKIRFSSISRNMK